MNFQVKVGEEFPCYVAEDTPHPPLIVNVTQNSLPAAEVAPKKHGTRYLGFALVVILGSTLPATVYGLATGDFTALKTIAHTTRDLLEFGMKLLR